MTLRPVIYDIARLATRFSRPAPNGIDRVDIGYAKHFLSAERGAQGVVLGPFGPRAIEHGRAARISSAVEAHWGEHDKPDNDAVYRQVTAFLQGRLAPQASDAFLPKASPQKGRTLRGWARVAATAADAFLSSRAMVNAVPENAVYLNVSQFPLWIDGYFRWLDQRPDVKPVFFLHDLLPIQLPEFFPPAEAGRHADRLEVLARRAAGVIVAGPETRDALFAHLRALGRVPPPLLVSPLPVSEEFRRPINQTVRAAGSPAYFVSVGTFEPRKNQILLLQVWRELAEELGRETPKLVLIGAPGWGNDNVLDLIQRCERLRPFVAAVSGLTTPAMVEIIRGAAAVLMPSFAEGFGLPVAEALATGTPVIASDIPPFRLWQTESVVLIDPTDGPAWRRAVLAKSELKMPIHQAVDAGFDSSSTSWLLHVRNVESFIANL